MTPCWLSICAHSQYVLYEVQNYLTFFAIFFTLHFFYHLIAHKEFHEIANMSKKSKCDFKQYLNPLCVSLQFIYVIHFYGCYSDVTSRCHKLFLHWPAFLYGCKKNKKEFCTKRFRIIWFWSIQFDFSGRESLVCCKLYI